MSARRSKPRKTADKMAVYKAAASKNRRSPVGSRTSPRIRKILLKASENGSPKNVGNSSLESQVQKGVTSAQNHRNGVQRKKVSSHNSQKDANIGIQDGVDRETDGAKCAEFGEIEDASVLDEDVDPETPPREPAIRSRKRIVPPMERDDVIPETPPREPAIRSRKRIVPPMERDDVIPETPPREPAIRSRKRIVPPMEGEISSEFEECADEVDKPTKKRRVFQTPPREEGSATIPDFSDISIEKSNSQSRSFDISLSSRLRKDEIIDPPLRIVRHERPIPLSRKFDESTISHEVREVGQILSGHGLSSRKERPRDMAAGYSASDSMSLDMIATSSATLSRMFDRFTSKLSLEIENLRMVHLSEMRKIGDELKSQLASETRNIQALFEMMSNGAQSGKPVRTGGNISLRDWEKLLDSLTPYAIMIFGKDLFSRILSFNAPLKAVDTYKNYGGCGITDVEKESLSAQTLLFRLQPADKKFQYLGDVGKLHSDFKFSVVRNAFFNVGIDSFGLFKAESRSRQNGQEERGADGNSKPREKLSRPSWLAQGSVSLDHISQARAFTETPGQSRKEKIRRSPSPDDIASHGALRAYRQLSKILHDGRGNLRTVFFQSPRQQKIPTWVSSVAVERTKWRCGPANDEVIVS